MTLDFILIHQIKMRQAIAKDLIVTNQLAAAREVLYGCYLDIIGLEHELLDLEDINIIVNLFASLVNELSSCQLTNLNFDLLKRMF